jgi:hypothetical protein
MREEELTVATIDTSNNMRKAAIVIAAIMTASLSPVTHSSLLVPVAVAAGSSS